MFNFLKPKKVVKKEDDDTFIHRIRDEIEEKSAATSGIRVFEHNDDSTLDDYERKILETLRKAHESWIAKHG